MQRLKRGAVATNPDRHDGTSRPPLLGVIAFTATKDGPWLFGARKKRRFMNSTIRQKLTVPPWGTTVLWGRA